jgi:hypothetical protein
VSLIIVIFEIYSLSCIVFFRSLKKFPSLPEKTALTSAINDKAISSGDNAPISSPAGA